MTTVAVILVNWNGWRDTVACLTSLRTLHGPPVMPIVVDNDSMHDSVVRIEEAAPDVTVLASDTNLGFAGGANLAIRHARERGATRVWLLNNDTIVTPSSLTPLLTEVGVWGREAPSFRALRPR